VSNKIDPDSIPEWERELLERDAARQPPQYGTDDYWRFAVLFNDITYAPTRRPLLFSDRQALTHWLWAQGWRRNVMPDDVNDRGAEVPR
jgi:hypothetical protein